ncbi:MAG: hypothetical protein AAB545_01285 [Patescibacteria group bacterium]
MNTFFNWVGRVLLTVARGLGGIVLGIVEEAFAGLGRLARVVARTVGPWVVGIGGLAWLNQVRPDAAEGLMTLGVIGFFLWAITKSPKKKKT